MFVILYQEIKYYKNGLLNRNNKKILLSVITSNTVPLIASLTGEFIFSPIISLQFAFLLSLGGGIE